MVVSGSGRRSSYEKVGMTTQASSPPYLAGCRKVNGLEIIPFLPHLASYCKVSGPETAQRCIEGGLPQQGPHVVVVQGGRGLGGAGGWWVNQCVLRERICTPQMTPSPPLTSSRQSCVLNALKRLRMARAPPAMRLRYMSTYWSMM